jgi:hypothetical protein
VSLPNAPGVGRAGPPVPIEAAEKKADPSADFSQALIKEIQQSQPEPKIVKPSARSAPTSPDKMLPIVDRSKVDPQLLKAAEGIEAMYLDYVMSVMRKSVPESEDNDFNLDSPATKIYQGMMDSEFAKNAARTGGIGLADQIIAYLEASSYNSNRARPARTGGTE